MAILPSFKDRIPSRQNPTYPDCGHSLGIESNELNPTVLLCTIVKKSLVKRLEMIIRFPSVALYLLKVT